MAQFPCGAYSNREVKRAGEVIAGSLVWTDETAPEIRRAFEIANSWRNAHEYPMRSIRQSVIHCIGLTDHKGITASRLKRMQAIRRKLRRIGLSLNQLQDLGGCRVIMESMEGARVLADILKQNKKHKHEIKAENNYIDSPKPDGYRSHHLIFKFRSDTDPASDGKRIELQVRTRLQHAWATAVEAVGLFRGEQLKNGLGSEDWLMLFKLLSEAFAEAEGSPLPIDSLPHKVRCAAIKDLDKSLRAESLLDAIRQGVRGTDIPLAPNYYPTHYLIRYDHFRRSVSVHPYTAPISAAQSYGEAERDGNRSGLDKEDIVLVEVDKIENLKAAYPNYFGDVEFFRNQLKAITRGESAFEYTEADRVSRRPSQRLTPTDLSWMKGGKLWRHPQGRGRSGN